jgi:N-methylhydantoinase B/oxoprolinase/acetone carboxylase alpha subunit
MLASADLTVIMERTKCDAVGINGGASGVTGRVEVHRKDGGKPETIIKGSTVLNAGDRVLLFTARWWLWQSR